MIANYHTHTARCRHAVGEEEEYVQQAIARGVQVLGFSDHTPYFFEGGYYSNFRMRPEELQGYIDRVEALRQAYAGRIELHLGLEVEYYPGPFPKLLRALQGLPIEYFVLGQHYLGDEQGQPYSGAATDDPEILKRYCDQVTAGMETGRYSFLAHPDLIHFVGGQAVYEREMRRLCRAANRCGLPLEINFLGLAEGRNYPDERFWPIAAAEGCAVVFGCDAHAPGQLADPATERRALDLVARYGLKLQQRIQLVSPL